MKRNCLWMIFCSCLLLASPGIAYGYDPRIDDPRIPPGVRQGLVACEKPSSLTPYPEMVPTARKQCERFRAEVYAAYLGEQQGQQQQPQRATPPAISNSKRYSKRNAFRADENVESYSRSLPGFQGPTPQTLHNSTMQGVGINANRSSYPSFLPQATPDSGSLTLGIGTANSSPPALNTSPRPAASTVPMQTTGTSKLPSISGAQGAGATTNRSPYPPLQQQAAPSNSGLTQPGSRTANSTPQVKTKTPSDPLFGSAQGERTRYDQEMAQAEADIKAMKEARAKGNNQQADALRESGKKHLAKANDILQNQQGRQRAKSQKGIKDVDATYYGNYCGKEWKGKGQGINQIDDACQKHDGQYDLVKKKREDAAKLEKEAQDSVKSPTTNSTPMMSTAMTPKGKQAADLRKEADAIEKQADMQLVGDMRKITKDSMSKDIASGKGNRGSFYGDVEKDMKFADCTATYFDKKVKFGELVAGGAAAACAPGELVKETWNTAEGR